jgi:hypothetical protein
MTETLLCPDTWPWVRFTNFLHAWIERWYTSPLAPSWSGRISGEMRAREVESNRVARVSPPSQKPNILCHSGAEWPSKSTETLLTTATPSPHFAVQLC